MSIQPRLIPQIHCRRVPLRYGFIGNYIIAPVSVTTAVRRLGDRSRCGSC
ncbi:MAG: hypothetical protein ACLSDM_02435 [Butyricicoccus sp.]